MPRSPTMAQELSILSDTIDRLIAQVQVLVTAVDELTDEVQWRNNQVRERDGYRSPPMVITSMPKDPLAPDFGKRLNRFTPADLTPPPPPQSGSLFD